MPLLIASGVAAGAAAATYFLDRQLGRGRRAKLRDRIYGRLSNFGGVAPVVAIDTRNRLHGAFAGLRTWIFTRHVDDEVLCERVRTNLARVVSHASSIEAAASGGMVTLSGPILRHERKHALRSVRSVPGMRRVADRLEQHESPGDVPGLQAGRRDAHRAGALGPRDAARRRSRRRGPRLLRAKRSAATPLLLIAGVALLARAGSNMDTPPSWTARSPGN